MLRTHSKWKSPYLSLRLFAALAEEHLGTMRSLAHDSRVFLLYH